MKQRADVDGIGKNEQLKTDVFCFGEKSSTFFPAPLESVPQSDWFPFRPHHLQHHQHPEWAVGGDEKQRRLVRRLLLASVRNCLWNSSHIHKALLFSRILH